MPSPDYKLNGQTIIWQVEIAKEVAICRAQYLYLLSPAELEKSQRFSKSKDSDRYIVTRVIVRLILASCVGLKPEALQLTKNAWGKPELRDGPYFNVSHSGKYIVLACAPVQVGIDIAYIDAGFEFQDVLTACFTVAEQEIINMNKDPRRAFYSAWTRKEAVLKQKGLGITEDLKQVTINDRPGLINLDADPTHLVALAFDHHYPLVSVRAFTVS